MYIYLINVYGIFIKGFYFGKLFIFSVLNVFIAI